jgi:hypothetical protein
MKVNIHYGDLWGFHNINKKHFIVIPTNITVTKQGNAVMGRGLAKQASQKYTQLSRNYGLKIKKDKTINGFYIFKKLGLIMFPVKDHWKDSADLKLIYNNLLLLLDMLSIDTDIKQVGIPMLGCGFGGLQYEHVLPILLGGFKTKLNVLSRIHMVIPPNKLYGIEQYRESFLPSPRANKKDCRVSISQCFSDIEI